LATLDDAAEALVLKLRGLDSEIEDSEHRLGDFRARIEGASHEVDQEWTVLSEAVSSFLAKVHEEQDRLGQETQQALQATADAQQAVATGSAEVHSEIAEGRAHLDALAQHGTGLQANVESLATEAGEAPAHNLAQRAAQVEQELVHALDEARDFVRNEVVHGIEDLAHDIRDRCQALRTVLAEENTHAMQAAFDHWESKVDELEEYVSKQGFLASHDHARTYVDYALGECRTICEEQLDGLRPLIELVGGCCQELTSQAQASSAHVAADGGTELVRQVEAAREGAGTAVSTLDAVRDLLANLKFVQI
jgi:hypothetical protein